MPSSLWFAAFVILISLRTTLFWLQSWQIREYRWDRMRAHFLTKDGTKNLFNLWFFPGFLPRPRLSSRILLIFIIFSILSWGFIYTVETQLIAPLQKGVAFSGYLLALILWERTIFGWTWLAVFLSGGITYFLKQRLFLCARSVMKRSENVVVIGITGSYGKSSTKTILRHLLQSYFGMDRVLYTPKNENTEVAIARLVLRHQAFFSKDRPEPQKTRYFVVEIGAYAPGEIRTVCDFIFPDIAILTGINAQHISLFGSQENIQKAKFELAEAARNKVFFNAESPLLAEIFEDQKIRATPIPIALSTAVENMEVFPAKTEFDIYGERMMLPWPGMFFVGNAILAMEVARELSIPPTELKQALATLPPIERALSVHQNAKGIIILKDLYSANPDGVIAAIHHFRQFPGKKVFVGIPLLELGDKSEAVHQQIFEMLRDCDATVFWWKEDFQEMGHEICGAKFLGKSLQDLKATLETLNPGDTVLLESRLPKEVLAPELWNG